MTASARAHLKIGATRGSARRGARVLLCVLLALCVSSQLALVAPWQRLPAAAVLLSGGVGSRFGAEIPKQYVPLAAGAPSVVRAAKRLLGLRARRGLLRHGERLVEELVIVAAPEWHGPVAEMLGCRSPEDCTLSGRRVLFALGGPTRAASCRNGLAALSERIETVLVHDAARPLFDEQATVDALDAVNERSVAGALLAMPPVDTVHEVAHPGTRTELARTLDRSQLALAQTPQAFNKDVLLAAHRRIDASEYSDDAALVRAAGGSILLVPAARPNLKITNAEDRAVIEALLVQRGEA